MFLHLAESLRWMKSVGRWRTRRGERGKTCDENAEIIGRIREFYQKSRNVICLKWFEKYFNVEWHYCSLQMWFIICSHDKFRRMQDMSWVGEWERGQDKRKSYHQMWSLLCVVNCDMDILCRTGDSRTGPRPSPREFRGRWPDDVGHKTAML